ncbi:hypothetical protein RFI_04603 [Reticulomyxa filosa]|uniref:Uncharacterized protein n=1 Tax=Reticulomyxa filosa TaxID=46433 RepID=X6P2Q9_RETFI|nr:hypothetical protein RFI_04603 [Reticulomyxa filosa]|eukprot:ETO32511.1 hypothetical protein RFI_04603 [Reticulomyxa filosa]
MINNRDIVAHFNTNDALGLNGLMDVQSGSTLIPGMLVSHNVSQFTRTFDEWNASQQKRYSVSENVNKNQISLRKQKHTDQNYFVCLIGEKKESTSPEEEVNGYQKTKEDNPFKEPATLNETTIFSENAMNENNVGIAIPEKSLNSD